MSADAPVNSEEAAAPVPQEQQTPAPPPAPEEGLGTRFLRALEASRLARALDAQAARAHALRRRGGHDA